MINTILLIVIAFMTFWILVIHLSRFDLFKSIVKITAWTLFPSAIRKAIERREAHFDEQAEKIRESYRIKKVKK